MASSYYTASIATIVLWSLPTALYLPLAILAQKQNRGGFKDPVRYGFNWFKVALWFMFVHFALFVITIITAFTTNTIAIFHLDGVAALFWDLGICALLLSIARLAAGAHRVDNRKDSKIFINIVRVFLSLSAFLYLSVFIFARYYQAKVLSTWYWPTRADREANYAFAVISLALTLAVFIVAVLTTIFSIVKRNQARAHAVGMGGALPPMRRVWDLIIPATSITIVTMLWDAIYQFLRSFNVLHLRAGGEVGNSLMVVYVILTKWVIFAVCVIVYVLGKKQQDGLWSIPEEEAEQDEPKKQSHDGHVSV